jgi:hypothetical protein
MSFFFRAASRPRQPQQELVRSIKDSLLALDTKTGAKVLLPSLAFGDHFRPLPGPIRA